MPTTEKLRNKLMGKLTELFQLDQPDLDFGFYRIMQAKAQQVKSFIDKDLLQIIEDAFGQVDEGRKVELAATVEKAIEQAKKYGAPDPEVTDGVMEARAQYNAIKDGATAESDVYDHLYRFFERYYDEGDFISRRYYARENAGKAAPFAIPYNGEEVKLHWANADQYYIKTAEYFSNYSFDLTQAAEIRKMSDGEKVLNRIPEKTLKVHFRIIDASEGEHGNVKAAEDKKRFFVLHEENPVEFNDADELVINFEYKSLPGGENAVDTDTEKILKEKFGKSLNKGDMPNLAIAEKVIEAASGLANAKEYLSVLGLYAPTDKIPNRPLLAKYIKQYTDGNTCDYFIHKDLSGFLKRELDFYIKNEVMHLDDIENADVPAVENYLAKLKVIRKIATKLIDFLAQLEDFQKKLWLKKKFVTETNYCITLDRVPEELYEEIAANDAQREEWVTLFAIDEIKGDAGSLPGMGSPEYSVPLTTDFLKANDKLALDTAFFTDEFKAKLIESIEDFDEQCDGLLVHSENFQALNLLLQKYRRTIDTVYTDPPYNKRKEGDFAYKDSFQHSSWIAMIYDRLMAVNETLKDNACLFLSIDENEFNHLYFVGHNLVGYQASKVLPAITNLKGNQDTEGFASCHEYLVAFAKRSLADIGRLPIDEEVLLDDWEQDEYGLFKQADGLRATGTNAPRSKRPNLWYPIYFLPDGSDFYTTDDDQSKDISHVAIWPVNDDGEELSWYWKKTKVNTEKYNLIIKKSRTGDFTLYKKQRPGIGDIPTRKPKSFFYDPEYSSTHGGNLAQNIFNKRMASFTPKSLKLLQDALYIGLNGDEGLVLDIFGGSGTTGHATISLNREYDKRCKYILVEMGEYFNTVMKPRITKVIYSSDWKNGKPTARNTGISHCFKYIRLESYEDTLNNLVFDENPVRSKAIESKPSLKEDYMLRYLLDVETRGSQSLLNIDAFADPTAYSLVAKKPGSDEQVTQNIDLIETFNYLLGLRLENMAAPQTFTASFIRKPDPELPEDQHTKLVVDGKIQLAADGKWWFRKLEGWVPADPMKPNNGVKERVLIVWRKLTGNLEEDNLMLDEWFEKYRISTRDFEYDTIYVNGSNNLPNLRKDDENWKVRLIEEEFHKKMWEVGE
ncbi:MAG: site-specific DNA-methyltransferase [Desulfobacterium sp.]|jgi:adenine-specific DNA-methyltransferase|nr:site-specific DNA-methyltransferase [Desulfobacterium sp.]MDY0375984.1 site-specific DNA-methyltransferase [Desulfobacterium sp.]